MFEHRRDVVAVNYR